jgi:hypothetical protein
MAIKYDLWVREETKLYTKHHPTVTRGRIDAIKRAAHQAVYDAADSMGIRDTEAAWEALRGVLAFDGKSMPDVALRQYRFRLISYPSSTR